MKYIIESSNNKLTTYSGLSLVGLLYEKTDLQRKLTEVQTPGYNRRTAISNDNIVQAYTGLLTLGKNDFEHIQPFRKDEFFQHALGVKKIPSVERLRQRLDLLGKIHGMRSFFMKLHFYPNVSV